MSTRFIARIILLAVAVVLTSSFSVLGYRTFSLSRRAALEVGKTVPTFTLPDIHGHRVSLADCRGQAVVLFFGSDQCSTCRTYEPKLQALASRFIGDGRVRFIAINSNTNPRSSDLRLIDSDRIPTLLDPMAEVARRFGASVTPTFCVIDSTGILRYSGSFDNRTDELQSQYCSLALHQVLDGMPVEITATRPFGHSITWLK